MKWPLKYQMVVPMTAVILGTIAGLSGLHAYLAARQTTRQISRRIEDVMATLANSSFPLTDTVLQQMKGLAGADFVLVDRQGQVRASTRADWAKSLPMELRNESAPTQWQLMATIRIAGTPYFHAAIDMVPRRPATRPSLLHVLYAEHDYLQERRQAIVPPIAIGGAAVVIVIALAMAIASRVSRPLGQLRAQVNKIADGEFRMMPLPRRHDEVRELVASVNQMTRKLADYESRIRRTEQLRMLAQLGGGLAHQLRNSATGARMALDIHRDECHPDAACESLDVATRQLQLMERYLQKFFSLGSDTRQARESIDFVGLVLDLLPLVRPAANHAGVELVVDAPGGSVYCRGESDSLEHMVLNLLLNAIDAAGERTCAAQGTAAPARVVVRLDSPQPDAARLVVEDTGPGPPADLSDRIFEPFVTAKPDGVGLGLAVVRDVVERHGGSVQWQRLQELTRFTVLLPVTEEGSHRAETARR